LLRFFLRKVLALERYKGNSWQIYYENFQFFEETTGQTIHKYNLVWISTFPSNTINFTQNDVQVKNPGKNQDKPLTPSHPNAIRGREIF
jgi:hypothetical protein